MAIQDQLQAYIEQVTTVISQETQPDTLDPNTIGDMGTDLADILYDYLPNQNRFVVTAGTASPTGGGDTDIYYRGVAGGIEVYRNILGTWTLLATIPVGFTLPDGILVGLRTSVAADVVTVTSGAWSIANAKYAKSTQTQFTLAAKDANFDRWDFIYADENDDVLILTGTATSTPVKPAIPANTIEVDYIYVPAVGLAYPLSNPNVDAGLPVVRKTIAAAQPDVYTLSVGELAAINTYSRYPNFVAIIGGTPFPDIQPTYNGTLGSLTSVTVQLHSDGSGDNVDTTTIQFS